MRASSFFPPGPERPSNERPLTDPDEVREARRILGGDDPAGQNAAVAAYDGPRYEAGRVLYPTAPGADPDWLSEAEAFHSADKVAAARELETWGYNPFELEG